MLPIATIFLAKQDFDKAICEGIVLLKMADLNSRHSIRGKGENGIPVEQKESHIRQLLQILMKVLTI